MIKNIILLCFIPVTFTVLSSQSISPVVLASGGGFKTSATGSLTYTIGETSINTIKKDSSILTQGFQQGTMKKNSSIANLNAGLVKIELFPNPASTYLEFNILTRDYMLVSIAIYDLMGQKVCDVKDMQNSGLIHHAIQTTSELSDAVYFARISVTDVLGSTQYFSKQFIIRN